MKQPRKSKVAVPKTEVLEQPQIISPNPGKMLLTWYGDIFSLIRFLMERKTHFHVKSVFCTARHIALMNTICTPAARMCKRDGAAGNQKTLV
jgi:hypothetical protein